MSYEKSINLHQQYGGMSVRAFAELEGLTLKQVRYCIRRGKVLGARQDARSKHWWIYPPAKLMERPRICRKPEAAGAVSTDSATQPCARRAAPPSGAGVMAAASCGHVDAHPAPTVAQASAPPAKPLLTLADAALPVAAGCGKPWVYAEARGICRTLHEAAVRRHREGIHYLRLDAREFAQLYAALDHDRSRARKLVGRGLLPVGLLRASDSVWQKMQALCRDGRLL